MSIDPEIINKKLLGHGIIEDSSTIECWRLRGFFYIGAHTHLSSGVNIWNAIIGRFTRIDPNVTIGFRLAEPSVFSNHYFAYSEGGGYKNNNEYAKIKAKRFFYDKQGMTFIGNDVRIHQGSLICEGITLGNGVIVYPNSVVSTDVPPYAIVAGNPAVIIGYRFSEEVIKRLEKSRWYQRDLSFFDELTNFGNVQDVLNQLELSFFDKVSYKKEYVNSFTGNICDAPKKLIIGPSHVDLWQQQIDKGERKNIDALLFGVNGLSLYSKKLSKMIEWFLKDEKNESLILFVPDFRIGNASLHSINLDPLFISKKSISHENDIKLYDKAIMILDSLINKYGSRVRLLFWCLLGREYENIKNGNYIESGKYQHPTWNYSELKNRYSENIIDIHGIENYIINNGTIHPNNSGYDMLEDVFSRI